MAHADVLLFHRIIHQTVDIKLPHYLRQISHEELSIFGSDHMDLTHVVCEIEERLDIFSFSFFNRTYGDTVAAISQARNNIFQKLPP